MPVPAAGANGCDSNNVTTVSYIGNLLLMDYAYALQQIIFRCSILIVDTVMHQCSPICAVNPHSLLVLLAT